MGLGLLSAISLNLLRAFDAAARHLNFTAASKELFVTQAAIAHQVKALEEYLGKPLFNRVARGLTLTDDGANLAPIIAKSMVEISRALEIIKGVERKEVLHIGVVGTFAIGYLLPRLEKFYALNPNIELRLQINNNVPDVLNEHLDFAIRFGEGAWLALKSEFLLRPHFTPLCSTKNAAKLKIPSDLVAFQLLRSHRKKEWSKWFAAANTGDIFANGAVFDNSRSIAEAAILGHGIGLLPREMFAKEIEKGELVQPFAIETEVGAYYLTHHIEKPMNETMTTFANWLKNECA